MFELGEEMVKNAEFVKALAQLCTQHGYEVDMEIPTALFSSPEGSMIKFSATFKHKLHHS